MPRETGSSRSNTRQERDGICWECDTVTTMLRRVALPLPSGGSSTLSVCEDCFETVYVPLLLAPSRIAD
jgi:hypothetical protein